MIHGMFNLRGRGVPSGIVVGIVTAGLMIAPPAAADVNLEQYIEVPQCTPATGQECPQRPEVRYSSAKGESVQAQFTANANGCSDALIRFLADDYPVSDLIRVSPNQTISSGYFIKGPGPHVLKVMATGVEGGCNTGILNAWGGTVRLDSRPSLTDAGGAQDDLPPCPPWLIAPLCPRR